MKLLLRKLSKAPIFSPKGFLARAAALVLLFVVCHAAGLREYTSVLCGMPAQADMSKETAAFLGIAYVMTYFMMVIGVPILVIAAGILGVLLRKFGSCPEISSKSPEISSNTL